MTDAESLVLEIARYITGRMGSGGVDAHEAFALGVISGMARTMFSESGATDRLVEIAQYAMDRMKRGGVDAHEGFALGAVSGIAMRHPGVIAALDQSN